MSSHHDDQGAPRDTGGPASLWPVPPRPHVASMKRKVGRWVCLAQIPILRQLKQEEHKVNNARIGLSLRANSKTGGAGEMF